MSYFIHAFIDAASFGAEVSSFLMKDEDKSLLIGLLNLVSGPNAEVGEPLLRVVYKDDQIVGVAVRSGDNRALIGTGMPEAALIQRCASDSNVC